MEGLDVGDELSSHARAVKDLEAEVKLLDWHRLANESSLRAALLRTKRMRRRQREEVDGVIGREKDGGREVRSSVSSTRTPPPSREVDGVLMRNDGRPLTASHPPPSRRVALRMLEEEERCKPFITGSDEGSERGGKKGFAPKGHFSSEQKVISRQLESVRRAIARVEGRRIAQERRRACGMFQQRKSMVREGDTSINRSGDGIHENKTGRAQAMCQATEGRDERLATVLAGLDKLLALERRIRALEGHKGIKHSSVERCASQKVRFRTAPVAGTTIDSSISARAASAGSFNRLMGPSSDPREDGSRLDWDSYDGDDIRILARRKAVLVAANRRSCEGGIPHGERSLVAPNSSLCSAPGDSGQLCLRRRTVRFDESRCHTAPERTISRDLIGACI